jgi:hypothetical protein
MGRSRVVKIEVIGIGVASAQHRESQLDNLRIPKVRRVWVEFGQLAVPPMLTAFPSPWPARNAEALDHALMAMNCPAMPSFCGTPGMGRTTNCDAASVSADAIA